MANNERTTLGLTRFILIIALTAGCTTAAGRNSRSKETRPSESVTVKPPLVSNVDRPDLLVGVSALEIAPPVLDPEVVKAGLTQEQVQTVLARSAQEILTLKIFLGKAVENNVNARRDRIGRALLKTEISQYRERQGSAIGGEPAMLAFHMSVVSPVTGAALWRAQYFYQQEPLSDNWLKINDRLGQSGSGTGWISGTDLLRRGITTALQDFNKSRESQFMVAGR